MMDYGIGLEIVRSSVMLFGGSIMQTTFVDPLQCRNDINSLAPQRASTLFSQPKATGLIKGDFLKTLRNHRWAGLWKDGWYHHTRTQDVIECTYTEGDELSASFN